MQKYYKKMKKGEKKILIPHIIMITKHIQTCFVYKKNTF